MENGINGGTRGGKPFMPDFQRALTAESREATRSGIETSPEGRARGEGWIDRARSSRRNSAGLPLMRMPDGEGFRTSESVSRFLAAALTLAAQTLEASSGACQFSFSFVPQAPTSRG